ncbi:uncharacterized protein LOC129587593 [Paramacrobiotus metropolitanus]|uniref:uncharacterized protein LOC129587593 n=1 Tax=Paramacrobiotus metropolitanus TaxID=2943436 RepID=UPI002445ABD5|nr:uncharacterized protein LOC129587593 [Paramacrobiotus metropolitanus]
MSVLHRLYSGNDTSKITKRDADMSLEYHSYALVWNKAALVWYIDGNPVFSINDTKKIPFDYMYIGMSMTDVGSRESSDTSSDSPPKNFLIDCLTVSQEEFAPTAKVAANHRLARAAAIIFRDDFDDEALDASKWRPTTATSGILIGGETQTYPLPGNVFVSNGSLRLIANKEVSLPNSGSVGYTSGSVNSLGFFNFKFDEIEWKAKRLKGKGINCGLYLTNFHCTLPSGDCHSNFAPSIHALHASGDFPKAIYTTVYSRNGRSLGKWHWRDVDMSLDYHIYKLIWTETAIVWIVDDEVIFWTTDTNMIPDNQMQINMGTSVVSVDESTIFPAEFLVDYVIVRQGNVDPWMCIPVSSASTLQPHDIDATTLLEQTSPLSTTATANTFSDNPPHQDPVVIIVSTVSAIVFVILVSVFAYLFFRRRKQRRSDVVVSLQNPNCSDTDLRLNNLNAKTTAALRNYIGTLEIALSSLEIGEILGHGEYGIVRKGNAKGLQGHLLPTPVAIKSVKKRMNQQQQNQLIQEMKIMAKAGRHLNIINLVGIVLQGSSTRALDATGIVWEKHLTLAVSTSLHCWNFCRH